MNVWIILSILYPIYARIIYVFYTKYNCLRNKCSHFYSE
jgi:hypothetical protein